MLLNYNKIYFIKNIEDAIESFGLDFVNWYKSVYKKHENAADEDIIKNYLNVLPEKYVILYDDVWDGFIILQFNNSVGNISKEEFVKTINAIKSQNDYDIRSSEILGEIFDNAHTANLLYKNILFETFIDFLSEMFNDKNETISHFIFESDFGQNSSANVYLYNNRQYIVDTPEKLYDFLNSVI